MTKKLMLNGTNARRTWLGQSKDPVKKNNARAALFMYK